MDLLSAVFLGCFVFGFVAVLGSLLLGGAHGIHLGAHHLGMDVGHGHLGALHGHGAAAGGPTTTPKACFRSIRRRC